MNCSQFDLKAYVLGELAEADRLAAEQHARACQECREELERLSLTRAALAALPEEEPPRRIAFVSDRIFEPSLWRRLWNSAPRLGFASAAMLAAAILGHALLQPAPVLAPAVLDTATVEARVEAEVARRLEARIEQAVADAMAGQSRKTAELLSTVERRLEQRRQADLLVMEENLQVLQKQLGVYRRASSLPPGVAQ